MDIATSIALGITLIMVGVIAFVFSLSWLNADGTSGRIKTYVDGHQHVDISSQDYPLKRTTITKRPSALGTRTNTED